jgi:DNA polymerase-3 subunit beta
MMLRAVATDGHRLARVEVPAPDGAVGMPGVIVPRKAVAEVQKLVEDAAREVCVEISAAKARFAFGDSVFPGQSMDQPSDKARGKGRAPGEIVLISKLIDGTFPDYGRVIPSGNDKRLVVEREPFRVAIDRVATISSERGRAVKLSLADSKLTLSVTNPDLGSAVEELDVGYDSTPIEIGFNARYLLDITEQLDGDAMLLKLADPGSPTLLQDRDGAAALYVLMPMRV